LDKSDTVNDTIWRKKWRKLLRANAAAAGGFRCERPRCENYGAQISAILTFFPPSDFSELNLLWMYPATRSITRQDISHL